VIFPAGYPTVSHIPEINNGEHSYVPGIGNVNVYEGSGGRTWGYERELTVCVPSSLIKGEQTVQH